MKIIFTATNLRMGGAQKFMVRLANIFSYSHDVYVYCVYPTESDSIVNLLSDSVQILKFPRNLAWIAWRLDGFRFRRKLKPVFFQWIKALHFRFLISRYQIDLIYTNIYKSDEFVTRVLRKVKIPIVMKDAGGYRPRPNKDHLDLDAVKQVFHRVNHIVYISDSNAQILKPYLTDSTPLSKIYNGYPDVGSLQFDGSSRKELKISQEDFVFGMVARGISQKGWAEAIAAFQIVKKQAKKKVHLILVGNGDYLASLKKDISGLPCDSNIHFIGYSLEPNYWIEAFDVGLLPTYYFEESLPNTIIEYLYMGKPVIATEVGGISEMLSHNNDMAGVTIPLSGDGKCDVIKLSQKMLEYSENNFLLEKHALLTSKVFEKFKMEKCYSKYESLFEQLISEFKQIL